MITRTIRVGALLSSWWLPKIADTSQIKRFPSSGPEAVFDDVDAN
jgi:hypothetical protein